MLQIIRRYLFLVILTASSLHGLAFSLLGPYAAWMTPQIGYQWPGDIGGPMNLGEEYRWNVPVISYAFDPSFVSYFGSNGVAEVEKAIKTLNDLPPASLMDLDAASMNTLKVNTLAQTLGLLDLKSATLSMLLEEMGLARAERYVFCLRDRTISSGRTNYVVIQRNFDPATFNASQFVNTNLFTYQTMEFPSPLGADAVDISVFPGVPAPPVTGSFDSVGTDFGGVYYPGLTRDDLGGLRYLLSRYNTHVEQLLPDVQGCGTNANNFVNLATRPGVDKITFQRVDYDAVVVRGQAITNDYVDIYLANGVPVPQTLRRISTKPDIIFTAADLGVSSFGVPIMTAQTGTTNWINNSLFNSALAGDGPGIIQPGIVIAFNKVGPTWLNWTPGLLSGPTNPQMPLWSSFIDTTQLPVLYPSGFQTPASGNVRVQIDNSGPTPQFNWLFWSVPGHNYHVESTSDFINWAPVSTVTNSSGLIQILDPVTPGIGVRCYRVIDVTSDQ